MRLRIVREFECFEKRFLCVGCIEYMRLSLAFFSFLCVCSQLESAVDGCIYLFFVVGEDANIVMRDSTNISSHLVSTFRNDLCRKIPGIADI